MCRAGPHVCHHDCWTSVIYARQVRLQERDGAGPSPGARATVVCLTRRTCSRDGRPSDRDTSGSAAAPHLPGQASSRSSTDHRTRGDARSAVLVRCSQQGDGAPGDPEGRPRVRSAQPRPVPRANCARWPKCARPRSRCPRRSCPGILLELRCRPELGFRAYWHVRQRNLNEFMALPDWWGGVWRGVTADRSPAILPYWWKGVGRSSHRRAFGHGFW